jgi:hypothetical protein
MAGFLLLAGCMRVTPLPPIKPAVDMFSIYAGRPSTAAEREQALSDCYAYFNTTPNAYTTVPIANQICMLQLGFRAPDGEPSGPGSSIVAPGNCADDPDMPVCWAVKYGWPQHPPPRWAKPGADPDNLGNVWYGCYFDNVMNRHAMFVAKVDQCMARRYGYTVIHPHSPADVWLPHKYWPNCQKPAADMNWLEKKWCPPGPSAAPRPAN